MNPNLVVTEASETDIPDLVEMIHELAAFEGLQQEVKVTRESLREALFGRDRVAGALVAGIAGEPAGYAIWYRTFSSFAGRSGIFLDDIYVRPLFRRNGVGKALLERVARSGDACGRYEWVALHWNENALRFYRDLGAQILKDWVWVRMSGEPLRRLVEGCL